MKDPEPTIELSPRSSTKHSIESEGDQESLSTGENICFYFRVMHENYNVCLKRYLGQQGLDGIILPGFGLLLFKLFERGILRPADISREMGITPPALSELADQMVKSGLIERLPDEKDWSATKLSLSSKGEELREGCFKVIDDLAETICEGIPEQDLDIAMKTMKKMTSNMAAVDVD